MREFVHHGAPGILLPWRRLLSLQIPCHVHWQRSYCRSRGRTADICRMPCFWDQHARGEYHSVCSARACVQGTLMRRGRAAGVGATPWVPGGGAWHHGWAETVGPPARDGSQLGGVRAGRRHVCPRCGVGHAWTLGLVRRLVALSGLLLRWPSGALGSCCVRRWWITETLLTMRTLRVARS